MFSWFWMSVILYIAGMIVYRDMLRLAVIVKPGDLTSIVYPKTASSRVALVMLLVLWPAHTIWAYIGRNFFPSDK